MYTYRKWRERLRNRTDMTTYLTHLTRKNVGGREDFPKDKLEVLIKILTDKKLIASGKGFINSGEPVVCLQDVPFYGVSQNVKHEMEHKRLLGDRIRYEPLGIALHKTYVFRKGGRPVIYEKPTIKDGKKTFPDIPSDLLWRIVSLDLSEDEAFTDWTHEREWRVKGDLEFELEDVYVILPDTYMYKEFTEKVDSQILKEIRGVIVLEGLMY
ncbi:DUF2971 domain-containing protein [Bacillus paralicheniformis]|uniref:DUF2971 domain-containing protein n=1 Tax=Bacillus paralicheniformis TaxID=1648923 RepID=UPI000CDB35EF|nr:DUF2971 domain-containing protein [Bacillus paralicheniformis]MBZ5212764.1 DUF2971 domain-containing protein [Bacillus paralicheniformis]POO83649.1 DUF2971 domain-containing protein [Bacillus sp. MBGLi97]